MAIAVIGGLLTSTALSLLVVPVVFTYVEAFEKTMARLFKRRPLSGELVPVSEAKGSAP
jgi:hypothetical protein